MILLGLSFNAGGGCELVGLHGINLSKDPACSRTSIKMRRTTIRIIVANTNVFGLRLKAKMSFSDPKYWRTIPSGVVKRSSCEKVNTCFRHPSKTFYANLHIDTRAAAGFRRVCLIRACGCSRLLVEFS